MPSKPPEGSGLLGLIGPHEALLKGLTRPVKGLIRPSKSLIRPFKGLVRPLRAL